MMNIHIRSLLNLFSVLGPPQLSTMLSMTEPFDHPFESLRETQEESPEPFQTQKSDSLNIQQKKGSSIIFSTIEFNQNLF